MSDSKEIIAVKAFNNYSIEEILRTQNNVSPSSDIYENADEYILVANMPGVARSEVQVKVIEESLILFGRINYDETVNRDYILTKMNWEIISEKKKKKKIIYMKLEIR
ncbi:MAG: Hsp20/alpha crystallin family protein [Ignavibacteriaceae bacterium]|nr:Hsp20/alpha crystallin family protein [Ignavibacteriaceae bacterium]